MNWLQTGSLLCFSLINVKLKILTKISFWPANIEDICFSHRTIVFHYYAKLIDSFSTYIENL